MSLPKKGYRWTKANGTDTPTATNPLCGEIWKDAPETTLWAGRKIVFAPDFSWIADWDSAAANANGLKRTAGNDSSAIFFGSHYGGGYWASLNVTSAGGGVESLTSATGRLTIVTDAADNDLVCIQFNGGGGGTSALTGLPFAPLAGTRIRCGIRMKITDITQTDWVFGLTKDSVDPIGTPPDGVYIRKDDEVTRPGLCLNGTSETVKALTMDDGSAVLPVVNTYFEAGFVINGVTSVDAYWNGNLTHQTTVTNLTTAPLYPTIELQNGEAAAKAITIEKFVITQDII